MASLFRHMTDSLDQQHPSSSLELTAAWSSATWAGRRGEDRIVAAQFPWPSTAPAASPRSSRSSSPRAPICGVFAVFDGHNGDAASRHAERALVPILASCLQPWELATLATRASSGSGGSDSSSSSGSSDDGMLALAAPLQRALVHAFLELHRQFAAAGCPGGASAAVVLQVGALVTTASVGSVRCWLSTGAPGQQPAPLTQEHRIAASPAERRRLAAAGCLVAAADAGGSGPAPTPARGVGPLRLWPGGCTLSRSLGDYKHGEGAVLPLPHVMQVLLPPAGARLLLVSDSVASQAGTALHHAVHSAHLKAAAQEAVRLAAGRDQARAPDASAVVVDVLPLGATFAELCSRQEAAAVAARGGQRRSLLRWGSRAVGTDAQAAAAAAADAQPGTPPTARLLVSFDSAQLLGLVPRSISPSSSSSSRSSIGRPKALDLASSGGSGLARLSRQLIGVAVGAPQPAAGQWLGPPEMLAPAWFDDSEAQLQRALLADAHLTWLQASRSRLLLQPTQAATRAAPPSPAPRSPVMTPQVRSPALRSASMRGGLSSAVAAAAAAAVAAEGAEGGAASGRPMLRRSSVLSQACSSARPGGSAPQLGGSLLRSSSSAGSGGSTLLFALDADSPRSALANVDEESQWQRGRSPMLMTYLGR